MPNIIYFYNGTQIDIDEVARSIAEQVVEESGGGTVTDEQIASAVQSWMEGNSSSLVADLGGQYPWDTFRWNLTNPAEITVVSTSGDLKNYETGYIPVYPGLSVFFLNSTMTGYDADKVSTGTISQSNGVATIPDGVYFVKLKSGWTTSSTPPDNLNLLIRGNGRYGLTYGDRANISYSEAIPFIRDETMSEYFRAWFGRPKPLAGKRFVFIGDSFTAPDVWCKYMCSELSARHTKNTAVSGGSFATYTGYVKTAYEQAQELVSGGYSPDYILITLGTNDSANKVTVGSFTRRVDFHSAVTSDELATFYGGLQACVSYLQANFPDAVIKMGWTPVSGLSATDSDSYITAMKYVCMRYGVEYIEVRTLGFSQMVSAYADCFENGTGGGHPTNPTGQNRIGKAMARLMTNSI